MTRLRFLVESAVRDVTIILHRCDVPSIIIAQVRRRLSLLLVAIAEQDAATREATAPDPEVFCRELIYEFADLAATSLSPIHQLERTEKWNKDIQAKMSQIEIELRLVKEEREGALAAMKRLEKANEYTLNRYFKEVFLLRQRHLAAGGNIDAVNNEAIFDYRMYLDTLLATEENRGKNYDALQREHTKALEELDTMAAKLSVLETEYRTVAKRCDEAARIKVDEMVDAYTRVKCKLDYVLKSMREQLDDMRSSLELAQKNHLEGTRSAAEAVGTLTLSNSILTDFFSKVCDYISVMADHNTSISASTPLLDKGSAYLNALHQGLAVPLGGQPVGFPPPVSLLDKKMQYTSSATAAKEAGMPPALLTVKRLELCRNEFQEALAPKDDDSDIVLYVKRLWRSSALSDKAFAAVLACRKLGQEKAYAEKTIFSLREAALQCQHQLQVVDLIPGTQKQANKFRDVSKAFSIEPKSISPAATTKIIIGLADGAQMAEAPGAYEKLYQLWEWAKDLKRPIDKADRDAIHACYNRHLQLRNIWGKCKMTSIKERIKHKLLKEKACKKWVSEIDAESEDALSKAKQDDILQTFDSNYYDVEASLCEQAYQLQIECRRNLAGLLGTIDQEILRQLHMLCPKTARQRLRNAVKKISATNKWRRVLSRSEEPKYLQDDCKEVRVSTTSSPAGNIAINPPIMSGNERRSTSLSNIKLGNSELSTPAQDSTWLSANISTPFAPSLNENKTAGATPTAGGLLTPGPRGLSESSSFQAFQLSYENIVRQPQIQSSAPQRPATSPRKPSTRIAEAQSQTPSSSGLAQDEKQHMIQSRSVSPSEALDIKKNVENYKRSIEESIINEKRRVKESKVTLDTNQRSVGNIKISDNVTTTCIDESKNKDLREHTKSTTLNIPGSASPKERRKMSPNGYLTDAMRQSDYWYGQEVEALRSKNNIRDTRTGVFSSFYKDKSSTDSHIIINDDASLQNKIPDTLMRPTCAFCTCSSCKCSCHLSSQISMPTRYTRPNYCSTTTQTQACDPPPHDQKDPVRYSWLSQSNRDALHATTRQQIELDSSDESFMEGDEGLLHIRSLLPPRYVTVATTGGLSDSDIKKRSLLLLTMSSLLSKTKGGSGSNAECEKDIDFAPSAKSDKIYGRTDDRIIASVEQTSTGNVIGKYIIKHKNKANTLVKNLGQSQSPRPPSTQKQIKYPHASMKETSDSHSLDDLPPPSRIIGMPPPAVKSIKELDLLDKRRPHTAVLSQPDKRLAPNYQAAPPSRSASFGSVRRQSLKK